MWATAVGWGLASPVWRCLRGMPLKVQKTSNVKPDAATAPPTVVAHIFAVAADGLAWRFSAH